MDHKNKQERRHKWKRKVFLPNELHISTWGIKNKIDPITEYVMWNMIEEARKKGIKLDWMQIFKLKTVRTRSKDRLLLKITQIQEEPAYESRFSLSIEPEEALNGTIWVMDDLTHATMMWDYEH